MPRPLSDRRLRPATRHTARAVAILSGLLLSPSILSSAAPPTSPAVQLITRPGPLVIAHRGFSQAAPENTLPAFRLALAARADLVELDYHHTQDGVPVVLHDATLDRTTDATNHWATTNIAVRSKGVAELAGLDAGRWFGAAFAGARVPTLVEALEIIQAGGVTLIERKAGDAETLVRRLRERGWLDRVVAQSFDWDFVRAAHQLAPELALGALGPPSQRGGRRLSDDEKVLSPAFIGEVAALGARVVVWNRQVSAATVAHAHERGLRVWVYTINDPAEAAALVRLGVDGIITDNVAAVRARLRPEADESSALPSTRGIPEPLADRPGNIHLAGEPVRIRLPEELPNGVAAWRLLDDRHAELRRGALTAAAVAAREPVVVGELGPGWYRLELDTPEQTNVVWTSAAVLSRLQAPVPGDSPVCVDAATAWFANGDEVGQRRFANLAALAGVNWVRDRLRWNDLQPASGPLVSARTTYDTAAESQHAAGLKVLQVFHDTPSWAREEASAGGRFAPDLRHVYDLGRALAQRFKGRVAAWEPWNEANIAMFGGHTVDEMCAWQKAAWLGFKAGDPEVIVGWNVAAAVPTAAQTEGVLANEAWPYFDTYNIHTYDWSHAYADLWRPAREALSGRPLWITEADRGTPHLQQAPWYDQAPHLERLKAEWLAQSYASSLFAGARRHFHFILGHYHEPNRIQFGLLRLDLTPRPAYVALAAVGRSLAGARVLGRLRPGNEINLVAFRAFPDGQERDVLVAWAEREVDWDGRGRTSASWAPVEKLEVLGALDYLGRPVRAELPLTLTSAPRFLFLPPGQAAMLPLEPPPPLAPLRPGTASPLVLQARAPRGAVVRVEDVPWSEGFAYAIKPGEVLELSVCGYNFDEAAGHVGVGIERKPADWALDLSTTDLRIEPQGRETLRATLRVGETPQTRDGWVVLRGEGGQLGRPVLAFRVLVRD